MLAFFCSIENELFDKAQHKTIIKIQLLSFNYATFHDFYFSILRTRSQKIQQPRAEHQFLQNNFCPRMYQE